jgi:mycofactocin precursor
MALIHIEALDATDDQDLEEDEELVEDELLVEEVSIDGMCGVY